MLSLSELQKQFVASLSAPVAGDILAFICANPQLSAAEQFNIYQDNLIGRLQKTLQSMFPVCQKLVGESYFINMINRFIDVHPVSADLHQYGESFSQFVANFPSANVTPYLGDVAALEWAWYKVFHAKDNPRFDFAKLAAAYASNPEAIHFILPEEASLIKSPYPLLAIWETNQENFIGDTSINLENGQTHYFLIWRKQLERKIEVLSFEHWQLLTWFAANISLGDICEAIESTFSQINLKELLTTLVHRGWIYLS